MNFDELGFADDILLCAAYPKYENVEFLGWYDVNGNLIWSKAFPR